MSIDEMTVMVCNEPGTTAAKTWRKVANPEATDGYDWFCRDYTAGTWFTTQVCEVDNIDDVAEIVQECAVNPGVFLVRGSLLPWARDVMGTGEAVVRRKNDVEWAKAPLAECNHHWLMLDLDLKYEMQPGDDLINDPSGVVGRAIAAILPPCFHGVRALWQLSNSVGFKPGFRAHLWYWAATPVSNRDLRALVFGGVMPVVDHAPFNAVQPHYVQHPIVVDADDPVPKRYGWIDGEASEVILPSVPEVNHTALPKPAAGKPAKPVTMVVTKTGATAAFDAYEWLTMLGDDQTAGQRGYHDPIRSTTALYADHVINGIALRDDPAVIARIIHEITLASRRPGNSRDISQYDNPDELQRRIDSSMQHARGKTAKAQTIDGRFTGTPYKKQE